jgi:hypothetical protein
MPSRRAESGIGGNARHRHRGPTPPVNHRHRALITPRAERPKAAQGRDRRRGVLILVMTTTGFDLLANALLVPSGLPWKRPTGDGR